ncbi:MAG TPA: murein biosynthesis integral membrane protein MurJ [Anaerolineales bacterium]|nr:murein biosynthesis integral membrane protein MurJ [Anaerolineales bacterium]
MSRLVRSTLIVVIFFGLEKGLGFIRQVAIAHQFGLSPELDAFNAANNIPDLIFALISGGALAMALIPVLSETIQKHSRSDAWELFSRVANLVFLVTAGLSVIVALLAEALVGWRLGIAPGFSTPQQELVADLMRLNLFATMLLSLGGLVIAGLQSNQHFLLPALAPSMYDLGMLFGVFILSPEQGYQLGSLTLPAFGMGIHGLVYGTILGSALFLLVQIPGLLRFGFRWKPILGLFNPAVQQVLSLLGPRVAHMFFIQVTFLGQDNIASRLNAGSISALVYGWLFMQVPETLIGTALGTVLLPTISEQFARQDLDKFQTTLNHIIRLILALTIPSAVLVGMVLPPVVAILGLDAAGTNLVVWTARAYLLGLMGHSLLEVAARAFYARQAPRTPMLSAALNAAVFLSLAAVLASPLGAPGIALANSIAFTSQALLLLFILRKSFPGLLKVGGTLVRVVLISAVAGAVVFGLLQLSLPALPLAALALLAGTVIVIPFILPEIKLLLRL